MGHPALTLILTSPNCSFDLNAIFDPTNATESFVVCFLDCQIVFFCMHVLLFVLLVVPLLYSLLLGLLHVHLLRAFQ